MRLGSCLFIRLKNNKKLSQTWWLMIVTWEAKIEELWFKVSPRGGKKGLVRLLVWWLMSIIPDIQ
jgi:hypothetical protein